MHDVPVCEPLNATARADTGVEVKLKSRIKNAGCGWVTMASA